MRAQVLRYSALLLGITYGVYHQASLSARSKIAQIDRDYQKKETLISQAKAEYVKKTMPADKKTESGNSTFFPTPRSVIEVIGLGRKSGGWLMCDRVA